MGLTCDFSSAHALPAPYKIYTNKIRCIMSQNHPLPRLILAFVAGFLSVLLFHQLALLLLHSIGFAPAKLTAYAIETTRPFGIPRVWSLAFWGGVWGIVLVLFVSFFRQGLGIWGTALLFGAIAPSLVSWFIAMPLRGEPVGGGWQPNGIATALILNGLWQTTQHQWFRVGRTRKNSPLEVSCQLSVDS